jgi:hypothetical protein
MTDLLTWLVLPVLAAHIVLDIVDKHRHGFHWHDKVSLVAYVVLAIHFGLDIMEATR